MKKIILYLVTGLLVSLLAQGTAPYDAARLAVYLHGAAGDSLSAKYSPYGVRPDDLPRRIAREIARLFPSRKVNKKPYIC